MLPVLSLLACTPSMHTVNGANAGVCGTDKCKGGGAQHNAAQCGQSCLLH